MKVYDCFMFFDESMILDIRLNMLDPYVDYFVICESTYTHSGKPRQLLYNPKAYEKFAHKIRYIVYDQHPTDLLTDDDVKSNIHKKAVLNAVKRENAQRNDLAHGFADAASDDWILISDIDEIPNLQHVDFNKLTNRVVFFKQKSFYYRFNLQLTQLPWYGTRACRRKHLQSPQWLRNLKTKRYNPFLRPDTWFHKKKYYDLGCIQDGGWHYTYMKPPELIIHKLKSYLHHDEFDQHPFGVERVNQMIAEKRVLYDHFVDQKTPDKSNSQSFLTLIDPQELPQYIREHKAQFAEYIAED